MQVNLGYIKRYMIKKAMTEPDTGDAWLDERYLADIPVIGHTNCYYKLLYAIAKKYKPGLTVELGSYWGTAAAHFAAGNPGGKVLTIDIHREDKVAQKLSQEADAHYDNLKYINGWTWDDHVIERVKAEQKPIDILFMDAWHTYEHHMTEKGLYFPLLADEALVIVDDVFESKDTTKDMVLFWDELKGKRFITTDIHGWISVGFLRHLRDE